MPKDSAPPSRVALAPNLVRHSSQANRKPCRLQANTLWENGPTFFSPPFPSFSRRSNTIIDFLLFLFRKLAHSKDGEGTPPPFLQLLFLQSIWNPRQYTHAERREEGNIFLPFFFWGGGGLLHVFGHRSVRNVSRPISLSLIFSLRNVRKANVYAPTWTAVIKK